MVCVYDVGQMLWELNNSSVWELPSLAHGHSHREVHANRWHSYKEFCVPAIKMLLT